MLEKIKKSFRSASSKNGSYSVGMIALVICMVIVVNLIAGQLPENVKSIDISDNNIYGVSKTSKKVLNKLDKKVTFKIYAEKDSTDTRIKSFIKKYTALSDKLSVTWIDPVLHPAALTKAGVEKDTIVISCKDTGKTKSLSFDDILVSDSYSYYTTGSSSASEFDGEGQFTSAINSVTSEQTEKMYYTTGHGEATFSDSVTKLFSKNNLTTDEVNLMMTGEIPDDCDLLFMDAPSKDISDDEKTLLLNYLKKGGKVFIILGDPEDETPNLDEVLKEYGMQEADGYIADMQRSYQGNYYYIFPEITATDNLANNLESEMVLMINAHGLTTTDPARDTITTTAFMQTSDNSYAVTEDKQEEGTYTLGAVAPLSAIDVTACMGASISSIHGFNKARGEESEGKTVAVIGDSTFMHSGMTGLANIAYNMSNSTVIILDNSITGMTGHQQNPTTGYNIKGDPAGKINLEALCKAMGFNRVRVVDPYDLEACDKAVKEELAAAEPSVIISRRPCALLKYVEVKPPLNVDKDKCKGCKMCMKLGCPAISIKGGKAQIDNTLCVGCGVCKQLCKFDAITE